MVFYSCDNEYLNYCHHAPPWPHQYKPCFPSQLNKYCYFPASCHPIWQWFPNCVPKGAAETWLSVTGYKDSYCETQKPGDQSGFLTTSEGHFCYRCLVVQTEG